MRNISLTNIRCNLASRKSPRGDLPSSTWVFAILLRTLLLCSRYQIEISSRDEFCGIVFEVKILQIKSLKREIIAVVTLLFLELFSLKYNWIRISAMEIEINYILHYSVFDFNGKMRFLTDAFCILLLLHSVARFVM